MASHRKPRPGGIQGEGARTPALATAALTSVAVLSQTAGAMPSPAPGRPSQEEIERKIDDFYRRAESAAETPVAAHDGGRGGRRAARDADSRVAGAGREAGWAGQAGQGTGWTGQGGGWTEPGTGSADRGTEWEGRGAGSVDQDTRRAGRGAGWAGRAGAGRAARAGWSKRAEGGEPVEPAAVSRRPADNLQRLRDEVARRAQHRGRAGQRAVIPGQNSAPVTGRAEMRDQGGTVPAGQAVLPAQDGTVPPQRAMIPAQRGTVPAQRGTVPAQRGTVPAQRGTIGARPVGDTAVPAPLVDTAGRPAEVAVSGPRAAKATVQKKLAHARVLLSQRTTPTTATPATATAVAAAPAAPSPATAAIASPTATPAPAAASGTYATKARKAIAFARAQVGKPCVWGAAGPGSYDCAGLTQAAWKSAGVTLPRTAHEQAHVGTPVAPAEARPGDLVFFDDDSGHVGLCTGDGMMIHAPRPGAYVREEPVSGIEAAVHSVVRPG
ncbi:C40 family peptidase [Streptomyces sp. NPDC046870]|uniref:C40 family peptidase n=1 Tax=Streptomyces sp. NPDC046870 TaxID=3155135 RepID=UPI003453DD68